MADCPSCGEPYTAHIEVESGDRLVDTFPAPPYSTFKRYGRICVDPESIQRAQGSTNHELGVYLHTWSDVMGTTGPHVDTM